MPIFDDAAVKYWNAGLQAIPLLPNSKRPSIKNWQHYSIRKITPDEMSDWLAAFATGNVGVVLGSASGLTVIDIDVEDPAVIKVLCAVLPPSAWVRVGLKGFVCAYKWSGLRTFRIKDASGATLVECLSAGTQVVVPPSIHPDTGMPYTANADLYDPAVLAALVPLPVDIETVLRAALQTAGVVLGGQGRGAIAVAGITGIAPGGRDVAGTKKAGELSKAVMRGELSLQEAMDQAEAWCSANFTGASAPSPAKFADKAAEFFLKDCVRIDSKTGRPRLRIVAGSFDQAGKPIKAEDRVAPFGWDEGLTIGDKIRLNLMEVRSGYGELWIARRFILIAKTGLFVDLETVEELSVDVLLRRAVGVFVAHHPITKKKSDTITECKSLQRVEYSKLLPSVNMRVFREPPYMVMNTGRGLGVSRFAGVTMFNVWPFLGLLHVMFPDDQERNTLLDWLAYQFQYPGEKVMWAPFLVSEANGVGKGTLAHIVKCLMHTAHYKEITTTVLMSSFNGWMNGATLVFIDEVQSTDRQDVTNTLKTLITSNTFVRNEKFVPAVEVANVANFILASNKLNALRLDDDDRRFFVLRIENEQAEIIKQRVNFAFFYQWLDDKLNRSRLLSYLLARDLRRFQPKGHAPMTAAKADMISLGKPKWRSWLDETLQTKTGVFSVELVTVRRICDALASRRMGQSEAVVREWCKSAGLRVVGGQRRLPGEGSKPVRVWAVQRPAY